MSQRVLIFGARGMLGHVLCKNLSSVYGYEVYGSVRSRKGMQASPSIDACATIHYRVSIENLTQLRRILDRVMPDVVINCIGIIKQHEDANNPLIAIPINSLFPHCLATVCREVGARLVNISTDCVFSGQKGGYVESDFPDCEDLYGRTKLLGEIDYPNTVTLRTSIIGHELNSNLSLIDWFLSQEGRVSGYTRAIYSGFPTVEAARIIAKYVIPNQDLQGLYHVSSEPISKYDLLCLVRDFYGKNIEIERSDSFVCDRSLDSTRFRRATGYIPPSWPELIMAMHVGWMRNRPHQPPQ